MKQLLSSAVLAMVLATVLGVGVQSASALVINAVRIFPGSGIAFDFQNPATSTLFVSSEVSVTGLPPASLHSKVFIAEYAPDGTLLREVAVDSPDFDVVGGERGRRRGAQLL